LRLKGRGNHGARHRLVGALIEAVRGLFSALLFFVFCFFGSCSLLSRLVLKVFIACIGSRWFRQLLFGSGSGRGLFFQKRKKKKRKKKRNNDDCGRSDLFSTQVASSLSSVIERVTTKDLSELQQVRGKEEEDFFFGFFFVFF
jgi:hypothetical protein